LFLIEINCILYIYIYLREVSGACSACPLTLVVLCSNLGRNGEESIPMLMLNHADKDDSPRSRPHSNVEKSPPRLVEISSNPGTPLKVTEIKVSGQYH